MKHYSRVLCSIVLSFSFPLFAEHYIDVTDFGAVADARKVGETWEGSDNSEVFRLCANYCRRKGLTMVVPKGNYGVSTTVWLTNPDTHETRQCPFHMKGTISGAYASQGYSSNICVLKEFQEGREVEVTKRDGSKVKEPYYVPVLGIANGRQVHVEGIGILGPTRPNYVCAVGIGRVSQIISFRNCSFWDTAAGIVFPGLREKPTDNVLDGNNDLLVVEQCTFYNDYNIVCGGTQPFCSEFRNSAFKCNRSIFTGTLITNEYGHSRGSHKFSSCLFGTRESARNQVSIYFDLNINEITVDSCHFETGFERTIPEVLVRQFPDGGQTKKVCRLAFTNNIMNFANVRNNPSRHLPFIDTMTGNRMIFQGNNINYGTALRIKVNGGIFIGNTIRLMGKHDLQVTREKYTLVGQEGDIEGGRYDFNHFLSEPNSVEISIDDEDETSLVYGQDFRIDFTRNAFEITDSGKTKINEADTKYLYLTYKANDASQIHFEAFGRNTFNPPHGWKSIHMTWIGNKLLYDTESGVTYEKEIKAN